MAQDSKIEWTTHTFNPWRGCTKVSPGCANCYAETLSGRNPKTLGVWGPKGTRVVAAESQWRLPVKWNKAAEENYRNWQRAMESSRSEYDCVGPYERPRVFCANLADVFEDWTGPMTGSGDVFLGKDYRASSSPGERLTMGDVRRRLFRLIDETPDLDWLLLTKRPENIARMMPPKPCTRCFGGPCDPNCPERGRVRPNVWLGVSVENQQYADTRIPLLLQTPAAVRFLSCEPLLGAVDLRRAFGTEGPRQTYIEQLDWLIVGGESGNGARPCRVEWVRSLVEQCKAARVACFVKQLGAVPTFVSYQGKPLVPVELPLAVRGPDGPVGSTKPTTRAGFRDRKGAAIDEWPRDLRVREFPAPVSS